MKVLHPNLSFSPPLKLTLWSPFYCTATLTIKKSSPNIKNTLIWRTCNSLATTFKIILTTIITKSRNRSKTHSVICSSSRSNLKRCSDPEKPARNLGRGSCYRRQLRISGSETQLLHKRCKWGLRHLNRIISSKQYNKTVKQLLTDKINKERFNSFRIQLH